MTTPAPATSNDQSSTTPQSDSEGLTPGTSPPPKPLFASLTSWVADYFIPVYQRTLGGEHRWCPEWWRHAEAISRLLALWYAFESARIQGNQAMGLWYRDHLDHQLPILMGPRGPFRQCSERGHIEGRPSPSLPPPPGWWNQIATAREGRPDREATP